MLFHSVQFLALFAVTFALYWQVHHWKGPRLLVLFVASFIFYAAWSPLPVLLFAWYALVNWIGAKLLLHFGARGRTAARKWVLGAAVTSHLGVLATFKYLNLFLATGGTLAAKVGDRLERGQPLLEIHASDPERLRQAAELARQACRIGPQPSHSPLLIHRAITE